MNHPLKISTEQSINLSLNDEQVMLLDSKDREQMSQDNCGGQDSSADEHYDSFHLATQNDDGLVNVTEPDEDNRHSKKVTGNSVDSD